MRTSESAVSPAASPPGAGGGFKLWQPIQTELDFVSHRIHQELVATTNPFLNQILDHICNHQGKRLRPALVLLTARMMGHLESDRSRERYFNIAAALEMIHMATLIHDDVIDESLLRRGAPSVNNLWGNKLSILVGDYLFSKAFSLLSRDIGSDMLVRISETTNGMCRGEIYQIEHSNEAELKIEQYFQIIEDKTARLIAICAETGGHYLPNHEVERNALFNYGFALGKAFQIVDDIFDLVFVADQIGKPTGRDLAEGKLTLPLIYALQEATPAERERVRSFVNEDPKEYENEIRQFIDKYDGIEAAMKTAERFAADAKAELTVFDDQPCRQILCDLADFVVRRKF